MKKVIIPSDAFAAYERAFRTLNPQEVEELLREMVNVQVAVVKDKNSAEQELRSGKMLKTVSVPYGVFQEKSRGKTVYRLEPQAQREDGDFLRKVSHDEILPNRTYVLLADEAGYTPELGLTFEGKGSETGFEGQPEGETREKTTSGRFQRWEEHAEGVWNRSQRILDLYRPFIEQWSKNVLELDGQELQQFVESIVWAMRIAVYLHDVGKLDKRWQETVWKTEGEISARNRDGYIARTSPLPQDEEKGKEIEGRLAKAPPHAPFAYPFLRTLLRELLGDYRLLDIIALATARHHSLKVSGAVEAGQFEWDEWNGQGADEWLKNKIQSLLGLPNEDGKQKLEEAVKKAIRPLEKGSLADEPPGPTDDFYFLYCLMNRLVKVCDWEDAGNTDIELR